MLKRGVILLFVLVIQTVVYVNGTEEEIVDPSAWGIAKSKQNILKKKNSLPEAPASCPEVQCDCEKDLGSALYIKLVRTLLRKSKPIVDDFDRNLLISIHLQLTEDQLAVIRETEDVRTIDGIISEVIEKSKDGLLVEVKEKLFSWFDELQYLYLRVLNSRELSLLCAFILYLVAVFSIWRFCNKKHLFLVLVGSLFFLSLGYQYMECCRRLEFENTENMKTMTSGPNPCDRSTSYMGLISNYDAKKCTDYMMSLHGHDRQFCEPISFAWTIVLDWTFHPTEKLLSFVSKFVDETFSKHGFIKGTLIGGIVMIFFLYVTRDFLKTFMGFILQLITGRSTHPPRARGSRETIEDEQAAQRPQTPSVVNVHVNLDPRAIGDYVQQVARQQITKEAVGMIAQSSEGSPAEAEGIEVVGDGNEPISKGEEKTATSEEKTKEEDMKKEKLL